MRFVASLGVKVANMQNCLTYNLPYVGRAVGGTVYKGLDSHN